jgi:hypothetical protein
LSAIETDLSARLAWNSGRTEEWIGQRFGHPQQWADRQIRFGQFLVWLSLTPMGVKLPPMPERVFRTDYWEKTALPGDNSVCHPWVTKSRRCPF